MTGPSAGRGPFGSCEIERDGRPRWPARRRAWRGRWGGRHTNSCNGIGADTGRGIVGQRQAESRAAAAGLGVDGGDGAAVDLGNPAGDGQAQPGAARRVGAESLEDAVAVGLGDTGAFVGDVQMPAIGCGRRGRERHRGAAGGMPRGVVEQIGHRLAEPGGFGTDCQRPGPHVDLGGDGPSARGILGHDLVQKFLHGNGFESQVGDARVQPGEREEVGQQVAEPVGLTQRRLEVCRVRRCHAVRHVFEERSQSRCGSAQFVGDRGDELPALLVGVLQIGGHGAERASQVGDLVVAAHGDRARVVALGHPARSLGHGPQRCRHAGGEPLRDREGDGDGHRDDEPRGDLAVGPDGRDDGGEEDRDGDQCAELDLQRGRAGQW